MLLSDFHCIENDGFRGVPVYPGLTGHAGHHKEGPRFMKTIITGDKYIRDYRCNSRSDRHHLTAYYELSNKFKLRKKNLR